MIGQRKVLLLLLVLCLTVCSCESGIQNKCTSNQCSPPLGNLVIDRGLQLTASSTCGSRGMERSCVVNLSTSRKKCFFCQSTGIYASDKWKHHDIKTIIPSNDTQGFWWQSQPGVENVTVSLDLEESFEVHSISADFPYGAPGEMSLYTSSDRGRSWMLLFYYLNDANITQINETESFIWNLLNNKVITNVRLNFTKLKVTDPTLTPFYSLSNLVVNGTCFCNGHGVACQPKSGNSNVPEGRIHSKCVCIHKTAGFSCDSCLPLYNDHPWSPSSECVKCNCNQKSSSCVFDQTAYDYSGSTSGGVCQDCSENRAGKNCERCKSQFYFDQITDYCTPCDCFMKGSLGNVCNPKTGQCNCKEGFIGRSCNERNENQLTTTQRTWTAKGVLELRDDNKIPFEFTMKDVRGLIRYLTRM